MTEDISIARRIRLLVEQDPEAPAYLHLAADGSEELFTWAELDRRSTQLARALAERGLTVGERLALALHNGPPLMFGLLAAWKLGAVPVPLRWDLPDWELDRLGTVIAARVFLGADDTEWIDSTRDRDDTPLPDAVAPNLSGICSGGSTGTPKVILTGRGMYDERYATPVAAAWQEVERPQRVLLLGPIHHTTGLAQVLNLLAGDYLLALEKFDAARAVDVIERHRVTTFSATPTMLQRIADLPGIEERDLSSLVWILQGAAPMPPSLVDRWAALIGAERIYMAYGQTESIGLTRVRGDEWLEHRGTVGRPRPPTEVRILGGDGNELPPGEVGEIFLRTANFGGYDYLGDNTSLPSTPDGFKSVGDMGHLDEDGYLYFADRRVDMIVTGGANVYPAEVEAALLDHPRVADVVVIGLLDPEWGRRVHAIVEPVDPATPPTLEEIRAFAKSRLAPYKVPKTLEIVERIPRSEATKVNRSALVAARGG